MSQNIVKTKTIYDLDYCGDVGRLPQTDIFVAEDIGEAAGQLKYVNMEDMYLALETRWRPTYEQLFTNVSLVGKKLYYPAICQTDSAGNTGDGAVNWRIMFLNSKGRTAATIFKAGDQRSGTALSARMIPGYPYTTIDWPYGVYGYLSVVNVAAEIDVLLRGYVGGYPDAKPYTYVGRTGEIDLDPYENAREIGNYAFSYLSAPTSDNNNNYRKLSSTVEDCEMPYVGKVGTGAFMHIADLKSINLSNAYEIGPSAFYWATDLVKADVRNAQNAPDHMFYNCYNISSLDISSVESIGNYSFAWLEKLTDVTADNAFSIGFCAFRNCIRMTNASFSNVTQIDLSAFMNCHKLQDINLPNAQAINQYAFAQCSSLSYLYLPRINGMCAFCFENAKNLRCIEIATSTPNIPSISIHTFENMGRRFDAPPLAVYIGTHSRDSFMSNPVWKRAVDRGYVELFEGHPDHGSC